MFLNTLTKILVGDSSFLARWLHVCENLGLNPAVVNSKREMLNFFSKIFAPDRKHTASITNVFHTHKTSLKYIFSSPITLIILHTLVCENSVFYLLFVSHYCLKLSRNFLNEFIFNSFYTFFKCNSTYISLLKK